MQARKYKELPIFTYSSINSAKTAILDKYSSVEHFEHSVTITPHALYKVNFLDGSFVHVVMTDKERAFFFKNKFSQYVDSLRGEGYQRKVA